MTGFCTHLCYSSRLFANRTIASGYPPGEPLLSHPLSDRISGEEGDDGGVVLELRHLERGPVLKAADRRVLEQLRERTMAELKSSTSLLHHE